MSKNIIIRVQSPDHGTKRVTAQPSEKVCDFIQKVKDEFQLLPGDWCIYQNRDRTGEIKSSRSKTLGSYKIRHGDMLYLSPGTVSTLSVDEMETASVDSSEISLKSDNRLVTPRVSLMVIEDAVDQYLWKQDGKIHRTRNEQLCRHGPKGKCLHCVPLEPYDEEYLNSADPPIKFLSFHSHLRKLTSGVDKGKFANLENLSCKIKPGCKEHPPWPGGICTKCQPNAVTLNRQKYRHVDYIQFENPHLVERFLDYWRRTGNQRIGILYGRYEAHENSPLGIKAVAAAIYEPPQVSTNSGVELIEDIHEEVVAQLGRELDLQPVGWIFTDLLAEDLTKGTVKHFRGSVESHFLSAEECIMAATFQNRYPNACKLSSDGVFGSKFVTVVVTGDVNDQIHFEGYQVSNQCMALVRDDCLLPTIDAPELGYVKESSNEQYIPDVFYKIKDEYGNEVTQLARPLPVEYLLVDIPAAFPVEPVFTFPVEATVKPFPIENRSTIGELQDFNAFVVYLKQFPNDQLLQALSDFHVLIYLSTCEMIHFQGKMGVLLEAVKTKNEDLAHHWKHTEEWATMEQLIEASLPTPLGNTSSSQFVGPNASPLPPIGGATAMWTCDRCTFLNHPGAGDCEMCAHPK